MFGASIGVAVHRGGNPVQKFFALAKSFLVAAVFRSGDFCA
jgi:hypothetical protein